MAWPLMITKALDAVLTLKSDQDSCVAGSFS